MGLLMDWLKNLTLWDSKIEIRKTGIIRKINTTITYPKLKARYSCR